MTTLTADTSVIAGILSDLSGGFQVIQNPTQPLPFTDPVKKVVIFYNVTALAQLGVDDFVKTFDTGTQLNVTTQAGQRTFTLSIRVESYIPTVNAYDVLERLRTKLQRPSTLARFRAANMTACSYGPTSDLPTNYDERVISVSAMDVFMALCLVDVDDLDDGNWIETVDYTTDITP